jgi:hypothetical protein
VLLENAAVHPEEHAGPAWLPGDLSVSHVLLHPDRRNDGNGSLRNWATGIGLRERNHAFLFYFYFFAESSFCLYIFKASLRTVSEISLLPETFFKSSGCKCFINPNPRSSGVRGFDTRFRTTM